jgi:exonuclease SbcC
VIPRRLFLRNFLCYGEGNEPLDLSPFRIICISGNNGFGKSALLDAMTWAIWGEARKGTRGKEELIRIGAREMVVSLDFEVEGELYRVVRTYTRGKGGTLSFFLINEDFSVCRNLTGPSIRETEDRIRKVVGMDFDTFYSSAYLSQGRSDEFTRRKSPRERKEILAKILGLARYDALSSLAREKANRLDREEAFLTSKKEIMGQRLLSKKEVEERIEEKEREKASILKRKEELVERLNLKKRKREELLIAIEEYKAQRRKFEELENELRKLSSEKEGLERRMEELISILSRADDIEKAYVEYLDLAEKEKGLTEKLLHKRRLEKELIEAKKDLERERDELYQRKRRIEKELEDLSRKAEDERKVLERKEEVKERLLELSALREMEREMEGKRPRYEELSGREKDLEMAIKREEAVRAAKLKALEEDVRKLEEKAKPLLEKEKERDRILEELKRLKGEKERKEVKEKELRALEEELLRERQKASELEEKLLEKESILEILARSTEPHCPLCGTFLDEEKRKRVREKLEAEREEIAGRLKEANGRISYCQEEIGRLKEELLHLEEGLREEERLLGIATRLSFEIAEAKAAEEELSLKRCELEVERDILESGDFSLNEREELRKVRKEKDEVGYDPAMHMDLRERISSLSGYEVEWERIRLAEDIIEKIEEEKGEKYRELAEINKVIESGDYGHEERRRILEKEAEISSLSYDEGEHERIKKRIELLSESLREKERLERARGETEGIRRRMEDIEGGIAELKEQISMVSNRMEELRPLCEELSSVEREISEWELELKSIMELETKLHGDLSVALKELEDLEVLGKEVEEIGRKVEEVRKEKGIYENLARAFSKDGIQALILENVIPEIEEEANRIISILTSGTVSIAIEPLRDLKSGGVKETLDILISDEVGTRSYELYSGGEAFRIDFALRVAISRVLARRAGTRLRTLIIDEGFGSQDSQGVDMFVEAINSLGEEFEKIIVVTHLEELKNKFPVRIEVYKHPYLGSGYRVIS